jgi:hypothetical protein
MYFPCSLLNVILALGTGINRLRRSEKVDCTENKESDRDRDVLGFGKRENCIGK